MPNINPGWWDHVATGQQWQPMLTFASQWLNIRWTYDQTVCWYVYCIKPWLQFSAVTLHPVLAQSIGAWDGPVFALGFVVLDDISGALEATARRLVSAGTVDGGSMGDHGSGLKGETEKYRMWLNSLQMQNEESSSTGVLRNCAFFIFWCPIKLWGQRRSTDVYSNQLNVFRTLAEQGLIGKPFMCSPGWQ